MEKILEVKDLRVRFPVFGGVFLRKIAEVKDQPQARFKGTGPVILLLLSPRLRTLRWLP